MTSFLRWLLLFFCGMVLALLLTMSTFSFMLLFWAFFAGVALSVYILRPGYEVPNLFYNKLKILKKRKFENDNRIFCGVCGEKNCTRERPDKNFEMLQPWIGINVNEKVDKAISEFLELLLNQYVRNWYRDLSEDEMFIFELKVALRHCASVVYRRVNQVNLAEIIIKKLIRLAVLHLEVCLTATEAGCKSEDEILMWYGPKVHCTLKSRRSELNYLRGLCDCLFPYLLPRDLAESKVGKSFLREVLVSNVLLYGIDVIDDPDKVNNLLLIFFDKSPPEEATEPPSQMLPFLAEFASADLATTNSILRIDLPKIMDTQDMLYQFMTFLKTVGAVHLLQFCLTVQDFNRRCLSQEENTEQQVKLHSEARDIYNSYCCSDSPTYIHFSEDIINELCEITNGQSTEVNRLRTSTPLFRAYDHVYNLLERIYCPLFYQSDVYYQMVCGDRLPAKQRKQDPSKHPKKLERDAGSRDSLRRKRDKVKETLKMNEEQRVDSDPDTNLIEDDMKSTQLIMHDGVNQDSVTKHDLATWRVEIQSVEPLKRDDDDLKVNERDYAFCINVTRVDIQEDDEELADWIVLRRYSEFYVLENKLTEFHGTLHPASLPSKKFLGSRRKEFLESKINEFQRFLSTLISQQGLRHSELLREFLVVDSVGAASRFGSKLLPEVKLGRLFRRVPNKLVKEKGQHLNLFLQSFVASCEASKPKPGKYEPVTDNPQIQMNEKISNPLYPESDYQFECFQSAAVAQAYDKLPFFHGVCDYLIFLAVRLFHVGKWVHYVMVGLKTIFKNSLEPFACNYLEAKIDTYRQEHHVVDLIHIFRDIIFFNNDPPRTAEDKAKRRELAYEALMEYFPDPLVQLIGRKQHESGCKLIFDLLQRPKLNKQLGYLLLDAFLLELFPELHTASTSNSK